MADERPDSEGPEGWTDPPAFFPFGGEGRSVDGSQSELVEVQVQGVFAAEPDNGRQSLFVLLSDGSRKLPIIIGAFEAQAISLPLDGAQPDRPMSHDLFKAMMDKCGVRVSKIIIDDLWNGIYYAKLVVKKGKDEFDIDARPSDAIALAVRFESPIYVSDAILETAEEV